MSDEITPDKWAAGWAPPEGSTGYLPVMGHPDCLWCYGTGAMSVSPYRYCYCVAQGGSQLAPSEGGRHDAGRLAHAHQRRLSARDTRIDHAAMSEERTSA
jgi:hypothetical protein